MKGAAPATEPWCAEAGVTVPNGTKPKGAAPAAPDEADSAAPAKGKRRRARARGDAAGPRVEVPRGAASDRDWSQQPPRALRDLLLCRMARHRALMAATRKPTEANRKAYEELVAVCAEGLQRLGCADAAARRAWRADVRAVREASRLRYQALRAEEKVQRLGLDRLREKALQAEEKVQRLGLTLSS